MKAEVIAVGTELLLGYTVNTNAAFLARQLAALGVDCYHHVTVGDNPGRLAEAVKTGLRRADWVITCGGLGPTVDDITLPTLTKVAKRPLLLNRAILTHIRERFTRLGIPMPQSNLRQAYLPRGAIVLPNRVGTAPGFLLPLGRKLLIALPGPPQELEPMVAEQAVPWLTRRYRLRRIVVSRTLRITGITESEVDERVADLLKLTGAVTPPPTFGPTGRRLKNASPSAGKAGGGVTVGIYAHPSQVDLRITANAATETAARRAIRRVETDLRRRLGPLIYGADDETLEGIVGALLTRRRKTLAVAESCTGGLLGHRITHVPGSSAYFVGGVVAYANTVKTGALRVPAPLLRRHGAVSDAVARTMAEGIRTTFKTSYGLAVTGIAGPSGGTATKPVGLVYVALADGTQTAVSRHQFTGDRATIKVKASHAALDLLRKTLTEMR